MLPCPDFGEYYITYGNNTFVAVGGQGTIIQSDHVIFRIGDINSDGKVDLVDVIIALRVSSSITTEATFYKQATVNSEGKIGVAEVIYILQKVAGMRQN